MKNKGLGISLLTKDWDQENQRVTRKAVDSDSINTKLTKIEAKFKIMEEDDLTDQNIDLIVESVIQNIDIDTVKNNKLLFVSIFEEKISEYSSNLATLPNTLQNYNTALARYKAFEVHIKSRLTIAVFCRNPQKLFREYISFERDQGRLDSTIKSKLKYWNICINAYNENNNIKIPSLNLKKFQWIKREVEKVYLTKEEVSILYDFALDTETNPAPEYYRDGKKIKFLLYFLFRCFSGMRISDMTSVKCQKEKLDPLKNSSFKYFAQKTKKYVEVPQLGYSYLYNIAAELNFKFPKKTYSQIQKLEKENVNEFYTAIIGDRRKFSILTQNQEEIFPVAGNIKTHSARRSFAKMVYEENKDIHFTSKLLGHSSITQTEKYLGLNLNEKFPIYEGFRL
ncbi:MAG: tyrosine-type recombinase/integrase [Algoriphagus sp.]|nr:tyrosine-type recombinase/integrase [Algoriphagus sp.]MDG1278132.1 tyrosine-type recombinase/integrase [Algoriphagus sp.]